MCLVVLYPTQPLCVIAEQSQSVILAVGSHQVGRSVGSLLVELSEIG